MHLTVFFGLNINKNYIYSVQGTVRKTWTHESSRGDIRYWIKQVQHCKQKINTAYSYIGISKRNFIHLDEDAFIISVRMIQGKWIGPIQYWSVYAVLWFSTDPVPNYNDIPIGRYKYLFCWIDVGQAGMCMGT